MKSKSIFLQVINLILFAVVIGLSVVNVFFVYKFNFLKFKGMNYVFYGVLFLMVLILTILNFKKKFKIFVLLLSMLLCFGLFYSYSKFKVTVNVFDIFSKNARISVNTIDIVVRKDSNIKIDDLGDLKIYAPIGFDKENIDKLAEDFKNKKNIKLNFVEIDSYQKAYDDLISKKVDVIVLNSSFSSLIELQDSKYLEKIKLLYEFKIKEKVEQIELTRDRNVDIGAKTFNIYVSGIDTYGSISKVSRSDVNIIMTVNMDTHKIVLTTTPRDSYVRIPGRGGNQYDKLTHAGIYGVATSVKTLENLYGIKIDYFARVNFTTFLNLIDIVGGVDVNNTQEFTSKVGRFHFPVGTVHLNSKKAFGFVRERYALKNGDIDRGKNQEKVIAALIKKLSSKEVLTNYESILNSLSKTVQTNMPLEKINALANAQLDSGRPFNIKSQALKTAGRLGLPSFAMPGARLYMGVVNNQSLEENKEVINRVLNEKQE